MLATVTVKTGSFMVYLKTSLSKVYSYISLLNGFKSINQNLRDYYTCDNDEINSIYNQNKSFIIKLEQLEKGEFIGIDENLICILKEIIQMHERNGKVSYEDIEELVNSFSKEKDISYLKALNVKIDCESVKAEILLMDKKVFYHKISNAYFMKNLLQKFEFCLNEKKNYYKHKLKEVIKVTKSKVSIQDKNKEINMRSLNSSYKEEFSKHIPPGKNLKFKSVDYNNIAKSHLENKVFLTQFNKEIPSKKNLSNMFNLSHRINITKNVVTDLSQYLDYRFDSFNKLKNKQSMDNIKTTYSLYASYNKNANEKVISKASVKGKSYNFENFSISKIS